jgi:alpha-tubulin suppressor-like RCC1 family protein
VRSATPTGSGGVPTSHWTSLGVGAFQACGIKSDQTLWCWGANDFGQSGSTANLGTMNANPTPTRLGRDWVSVTAGDFNTCAVKTDHTAWCWGDNDAGQLGTSTNLETTTPNPLPQQVGDASDWLALSAGDWHTCGVKLDGTLWCWGNDQFGQLGSKADAYQGPGPTQVGTGTDWTSVTAGGQHTCALKVDHSLWCWGDNQYGQLGVETAAGTDTPNPTPVQIDGSWASVAAGDKFTCGTRSDGTLWCWGRNDVGQLAESTNLGTDTPNPAPVQVGDDADWASLAPGLEHACGVKTDGTAWCWGAPNQGELGTGTTGSDPVTTPAEVGSGTTWSGLTAGWSSTCGLGTDGTAWCWGDNGVGELGSSTDSGTANPNPTPLQVGTY